MRLTTVAVGVALALGASVSPPATAQSLMGTATQGAGLESLQACLDARGYGQRNWSAVELQQNVTACLGEAFVPPSCPVSPFSRALAVSFRYGEPHPTWSPNDRARIADQLPQWIEDALRQQPQIRGSITSGARPMTAAATDAPWQLEVEVRYAGSGWSQRDLDDWVRQPRSLQVYLSLRERDSGTIKDRRELKLSFPPQLRARDADTSGARWLAQLETGIRQSTTEMLSALSCLPDVLSVAGAVNDELRVSFGDLRLRPNQTEFGVTLVPADGQLPAALWPRGRVTAQGSTEGRLTLLEGEDDLCLRETCVAIPAY